MGEIVCDICMHHCKIKEGERGFCRIRENRGGVNVCGNYGMLTSLALDPIEKKPLNEFFPGSKILSAGSYGCNLKCPFCQNHEISMAGYDDVFTQYYSPETIAELALSLRERGNIGVAFTYNEPMISWEYIRDVAALIRDCGMKTVIVTNGSVGKTTADVILPLTDALNIDLKGFTEEYYKMLAGDLKTVKEFIKRAVNYCHVELTTLIVPGENDSTDDMEREAAWIASIDRDIPLHITRFYPRYHMMDKRPTDAGLVYKLAETARRHLRHVYL